VGGLVDPLNGKNATKIDEKFVDGATEMVAEERGLQESTAMAAPAQSLPVDNCFIHRFQANGRRPR
jgi:hypothetical protein